MLKYAIHTWIELFQSVFTFWPIRKLNIFSRAALLTNPPVTMNIILRIRFEKHLSVIEKRLFPWMRTIIEESKANRCCIFHSIYWSYNHHHLFIITLDRDELRAYELAASCNLYWFVVWTLSFTLSFWWRSLTVAYRWLRNLCRFFWICRELMKISESLKSAK